MTRENTPHECGLGKFCQTADAIGCIGRDALIRTIMEGPRRQIRGLRIDGAGLPATVDPWAVMVGEEYAGQVTSCAFSPRLKTNVAIGMIEEAFWEPGTAITVDTPDGPRDAEVVDLPFPN